MSQECKEIDNRSLDRMITISLDEYHNELKRAEIIDNKAGIAIPIVSGYILAIIVKIDFKSLLELNVETAPQILKMILLVLIAIATLLLAFGSLISLVGAIRTRKFDVLEPIDFCKEKYILNSKKLDLSLIHIIDNARRRDKNENNKKVKSFEFGIKFAFSSLICYCIYYWITY